ncbi:FAD/NAD(P)-binding domain-containing protein [Apiospora sp. TS-2023a]
MSQSLHAVVVGAGIGGLAFAILARKQGLRVTVLEKTEKLTPVGAGIQIPPNASRIWSQCGVLEKLKKFSVVSEATQLRRWKNGELLCTRTVGEALDERWPWLVIHRADYQRILVQEAQELGVTIRLGSHVQAVDFDLGSLTLASGEVITGDIIVGADGLWSSLRNAILGHDSPPQETGDLAYRGTFSISALQGLNDAQVDELCSKNIVTMWIGPESHAVFYPVRCGKEFNLVLTRPDNLPPNVRTEKGNLSEMVALFQDWDPVLTKILSAFSSVLKWKMLHHEELANWTRGNVALLGDACHPSLPYQAQGAAMAVEDGAALATLLGLYQQALHRNGGAEEASKLTIPQILENYEALQKARTTRLHLGSISNQHLYHLEDGEEQKERDRILRAAEWKEKPLGETEAFIWIDVRYQMAIVGRDTIADTRAQWDRMVSQLGTNE